MAASRSVSQSTTLFQTKISNIYSYLTTIGWIAIHGPKRVNPGDVGYIPDFFHLAPFSFELNASSKHRCASVKLHRGASMAVDC